VRRIAVAGSGVFVLALTATAVAGQHGAVQRETLVRARAWCSALVAGDPLRYQTSMKRNYFHGRFDRLANAYLEPSDAQILAAMPRTRSCRATQEPIGPDGRGRVHVTVQKDSGDVQLVMKKESGSWFVEQILPR
jgi:hypothetical protein